MDQHLIKCGDYVIVQRQDYTKLTKLKKHGTIKLGKDEVELDNVQNERYYETFKMVLKPNSKRVYELEVAQQIMVKNQVNLEQSGLDNRDIIDDGLSQTLTKEQIEEFRDQALSSSSIVEKLIENSKTFNAKTEYSQEKYLKKKEKKYFEFIQIRKPSVRLLAQTFYRLDPSKTLGMRIDDLSQILMYSNIQADGNYLLYDSGTSGLLTAAIVNALGANTKGRLIHSHPGNECQKNAFVAMQYPKEQEERCINVNLYSVLRCFYQNKESFIDDDKNEVCDLSNTPPTKKRKIDEVDGALTQPAKKQCWQVENEKACKILQDKVDGIVIVSKEHPVSIVEELVEFLKGGRPLVVFSLLKEPLQDLYYHLKKRTDFIAINLSNNFVRNYQILPERTHPEISMNSGGYILSCFKVVN